MKKLALIIPFARGRSATSEETPRDQRTPRAIPDLTCRWQVDAADGRLRCLWTAAEQQDEQDEPEWCWAPPPAA